MNGVVRITHRDTGHLCSGAVLSSRLVLTALHCALDPHASESTFLPTDGFRVYFGPDSASTIERNVGAVHWLEPILSGSVVDLAASGRDVVLLELSEAVPVGVEPYAPAFDYKPQADQLLTLAGFGLVSIETGQGGVRRAASATLTGFDADTGVLQLDTPNAICFGDSGGPVLQANGMLVGVIGQAAGTSDASFCDTSLGFAASLANPVVRAFVRERCARLGGCAPESMRADDAGGTPGESDDASVTDAASALTHDAGPDHEVQDSGSASESERSTDAGCSVVSTVHSRKPSGDVLAGLWLFLASVLLARRRHLRAKFATWVMLAGLVPALGACDDAATTGSPDASDSALPPGMDIDAAPSADSGRPPGDAAVIGMDADLATDAVISDADARPDGDLTDSSMHPVSEYCGDAIRDPVTEECDDGDDALGDFCFPDCRAAPSSLLPDAVASSEPDRRLGEGPHLLADHGDGFVAVYVQHETTATVWAQRFDENGVALGSPLHLSAGTTPVATPNPSVATLPDGRAVIAWTDASASMPDVVLRALPLTGNVLPPLVPAHSSAAGPQQDADLIWIGDQLIVAWTDLLDVKYRRFDAQLAPLGPVQSLASSADIETGVTLARSGDVYAAAYRSVSGGLERVRVTRGALSWYTPEAPPSPTADRPALIALTDGNLLLAYVIGTDPGATGTANVGRLRLAYVDLSTAGALTPVPLDALDSPYVNDPELSQRRPTLAHFGDSVFVAWQHASPAGDARTAEVFVHELTWLGAALDQRLDRTERFFATLSRAGDQRAPAFGSIASFPSGAIGLLWEQQSAPIDTPQIWLGLRATPLVTLP